MRAAVTGGAGFIGSHVVDALVARGDEVHVVDDFSTGRRENVTARRVHEHDIREPLDGLFDEIRPELVVHLAAQADVGTSVAQPVLRRRGERPRHAERPRGSPSARCAARLQLHRRRDLRRVRPPGARGRRAPAALSLRHREARGRGVPRHVESPLRERHVVLRFANVYGPRQLPKLEGGVVAIFMDRLRAGERGDDLRRRRPDARLRLRRRRRRGDPRRRRAGRRHLQRRHRAWRRPSTISSPRRAAPQESKPTRAMRLPAPATCAAACSTSPAASSELGWRRADAAGRGPRERRGAESPPRRSSRSASPSGSAPRPRCLGARSGAAADRRRVRPGSDFLFRTFSQWDARWFLQIAMHGYEEVPQAAAFFPVYPAVVHAPRLGDRVDARRRRARSRSPSSAVAAWVLAQIARPLLGERGAHDAVLYFALYPVGFVFTSLYSEGLFLALAAGSFLAATRGKPVARRRARRASRPGRA